MKILVYTVNLGNYDCLDPPAHVCNGFDYVQFNCDGQEVRGWQTMVVEPKADAQRQSREIKINIHKFEPNYDVYIYMDASAQILKPLSEYLNRYFKGGVLLHRHGLRACTYQEARKVIDCGIDTKETVGRQMTRYKAAGLPVNYGLFENGFFIRDQSINDLFEKWYDEIEKGSYRDQLSLPYCLYKYRASISALNSSYKRRYIKFKAHEKAKANPLGPPITGEAPKVWYFTPGRGNKDLGTAYNDHCALVPDGDWICIMDGDVIFLNPFWSKQIEDIITKHGARFPLISCLTNRLGLKWQLPYGFSEDPNILNHAKIADRHYADHYDEVTTSPEPTAGLFMLFPKSTWDKVKFLPGLTNGGTFVDWSFSDAVMRTLGKIGIAKGIYIFHFYRFNRKSKRDIDHLKDI